MRLPYPRVKCGMYVVWGVVGAVDGPVKWIRLVCGVADICSTEAEDEVDEALRLVRV